MDRRFHLSEDETNTQARGMSIKLGLGELVYTLGGDDDADVATQQNQVLRCNDREAISYMRVSCSLLQRSAASLGLRSDLHCNAFCCCVMLLAVTSGHELISSIKLQASSFKTGGVED